VFLDKDGTLIENVPFNADPEKIRLLPGAAEGVRRLHRARYQLIVVSNQSGVAQGHFPEDALIAAQERLESILRGLGVRLAGFYYCPHHPDGKVEKYRRLCACRKPEPGLLHRAAAELHLELSGSWLIGDILDDVEAGNRAGCRTVLVETGGETEWRRSALRTPTTTVTNLEAAALAILAAPSTLESGTHR
jgi:histidinol-phosphate phosphatase family protein